jgi:hypothetical protein
MSWEECFRRRQIGEPGSWGGETSKQHSLEELKYLETRAYFHHSEGPEIRRQTSFSPRDEFIRLGSLIARPPLLRG